MSKLKETKNGLPLEVPYKISDCEEKELGYKAIAAQISFLLGKVLTIIDASIEDEQRNKAIKDLIRNAFSDKLDWIYQLCGLPEINDVIGDGEEIIGDLPDQTVEQVLSRK